MRISFCRRSQNLADISSPSLPLRRLSQGGRFTINPTRNLRLLSSLSAFQYVLDSVSRSHIPSAGVAQFFVRLLRLNRNHAYDHMSTYSALLVRVVLGEQCANAPQLPKRTRRCPSGPSCRMRVRFLTDDTPICVAVADFWFGRPRLLGRRDGGYASSQ